MDDMMGGQRGRGAAGELRVTHESAGPSRQPPELGAEVPPRRELRDPRAMRALAHPVRLALLEVLAIDGPLTATEAGERIGESPTTCSFHLRQLAKYGLVEEAGGGPGRRRPWRIAYSSMHFTGLDNSESVLAADALERAVRERYFGRLQTWLETRRSYPAAWQEAAESGEYLVWVTAEELMALHNDISAFFERYQQRRFDSTQRPAEALPVEALFFTYPVHMPGAGTSRSERGE